MYVFSIIFKCFSIDVPILQCFNDVSYKYPLEREPHVSLLINMGFSALAIGNRVGHETEKITYRYAHLFPTVQNEMAEKLEIERMTKEA